jgi:hypothetical protein
LISGEYASPATLATKQLKLNPNASFIIFRAMTHTFDQPSQALYSIRKHFE